MSRLARGRIAILGDLHVVIIKAIFLLIRAFMMPRLNLVAENLALRYLSLDRNSPTPRRVEPPSEGEVVAVPQVGGLHHRYTRRAA